MTGRIRVTAENGLRLRDSPRDGITLEVLPKSAELELLGRETWLRVSHDGRIGFVLADYVENIGDSAPPIPAALPPAPLYSNAVNIIDFRPNDDVFTGAPLRVDEEFVPCVREIGHFARTCQVRIFVNSSLREPGKPVPGAIVDPARFSNHHVGHAIDMNVLVGDRLLSSTELRDLAHLPAPAAQFINAVRAKKGIYRWGGDFTKSDPVHIDNGLNVFMPKIYSAKLQKLWGLAMP